jgi:DNA repair exonuclease SbcCD ATPase subunit
MNRSILIVICDFLLVSLVAFSTLDINKVAEEGAPPVASTTIVTNQAPDAGKDLANVMRLALNEERKNRDLLMGELARSREALTRQQALLGEREEQVQTFQQQLSASEQEAVRLHSERTALEQQYTSAQTNLDALNRQLLTVAGEANVHERAATIDAELRKQAEQAAELQKRLSSLEQSNRVVLEEKQRLSTRLQVAEVEKRSAAELATRMEQQAKIEREERARIATHAEKLAENVKSLASNSGELAQEIREHRPIAPNMIFADVVANRVEARTSAKKPLVTPRGPGKLKPCLRRMARTPLPLPSGRHSPGSEQSGR